MLIKISEDLEINAGCVESLQRKGKLACVIVMQSGEKHLIDVPKEILSKKLNDESNSALEILKNIDSNTMRTRL